MLRWSGLSLVTALAVGCADAQLGPSKDGQPTTNDPGDLPDDGDPATDDGDDHPDPEPDVPVVRFAAMGDAGTGSVEQYQVGAAIDSVCALRGCDFVLYLGDNIYGSGASSVDDEQFVSKFEAPYAALDLPFYVVLGNHDYGETAIEQHKGQYEIDYTGRSTKWTMPDAYYHFQAEHVQFIGLDSNAIMLDWTMDEQRDMLNSALATTTASWNIVFAHHPYRSNGKHGNAGNYEGCSFCPYVNGEKLEEFVEQYVCGKADLYITGHDHNRQWLAPTCGTEFVVSGGGAKLTTFVNRDGNDTLFGNDSTPGFFWFEIKGDTLYGASYDINSMLQFDRTITR
jgi:tartrate-resistant acid phosphatase type 5